MFSICLDETTDVSSEARIAVVYRYPSGDTMNAEPLKLLWLCQTTMGEHIFEAVLLMFSKLHVIWNRRRVKRLWITFRVFLHCFQKAVGDPVVPFVRILHQLELWVKWSQRFGTTYENSNNIVNLMTSVARKIQNFKILLVEVKSQRFGTTYEKSNNIVNLMTSVARKIRNFKILLVEVNCQCCGLHK